MILHTAYLKRRTFLSLARTNEIRVEAFSECIVPQKRSTVLRRKDEVNVDLDE